MRKISRIEIHTVRLLNYKQYWFINDLSMLSFVHCKPIRINYRPQRSDISSWIIEATVNIWRPACLPYFHRPVFYEFHWHDVSFAIFFDERRELLGLFFWASLASLTRSMNISSSLYLSNTHTHTLFHSMELALTTKINEKILEEEVMHKIYTMKSWKTVLVLLTSLR